MPKKTAHVTKVKSEKPSGIYSLILILVFILCAVVLYTVLQFQTQLNHFALEQKIYMQQMSRPVLPVMQQKMGIDKK